MSEETTRKIRVELLSKPVFGGVYRGELIFSDPIVLRSFELEDETKYSFKEAMIETHKFNGHLGSVDEDGNFVMIPYDEWSKAEIIITDITEEEKETV